jgi:signal transduction histidine kinase/CheY-like chemotaxis protein
MESVRPNDADEEKFQAHRFVEMIKYLVCNPLVPAFHCMFAVGNGILVASLTPESPGRHDAEGVGRGWMVASVVMVVRLVSSIAVLLALKELPNQCTSWQRSARISGHLTSAGFPLCAVLFQICCEGIIVTTQKIAALPAHGLALVVLMPMFYSVVSRMPARMILWSRLPHLLAMCCAYSINPGQDNDEQDQSQRSKRILAILAVFWIWSLLAGMLFYQEKLERHLYFAQEKDTERNMSAFLCHEIRNPLNGITGSLEQIDGNTIQPELVAEWCHCGLVGAKHLSDILDNVLDQSKLEQGKLKLDSRPLDLSIMCTTVTDMLKHTGQEEVALVTTVPQGLSIIGDEVRWRQLLINLISNALKFTKAGKVWLKINRVDGSGSKGSGDGGRANNEANKSSEQSEQWDIGTLNVEICDTGLGISSALMPSLFSRYSQGGFHAGSGLGLNIASKLVELMGSNIKVSSPWRMDAAQTTPGTKFSFVIENAQFCKKVGRGGAPGARDSSVPANGSQQPQDVRPDTEAATGLVIDSCTILLVEDDSLNCMIMKAKLEQVLPAICADFTINVTNSGEKALETYTELEGEIDLILMDEHLQHGGGTLKGTETTKQLRERGCKAVIVACSGNCLAPDITAYMDAGSTSAWPKPYPDSKTITGDLLGWFGKGSAAAAKKKKKKKKKKEKKQKRS